MEKNKSTAAYLAEVGRQLEQADLSRLDLDELRERLTELGRVLAAHESLAIEHASLRDDYQKRIGGMAKALAAVDRKRDRWDEAVNMVEELPTLTVGQLLDTFRRVSARFRDSFPGSFGLLRSQRGERA